MRNTQIRSIDERIEPAPTCKLTLSLPDYVRDGLKIMAAEESTTVKKLLLAAIDCCLLRVHPIDMEDQRGVL